MDRLGFLFLYSFVVIFSILIINCRIYMAQKDNSILYRIINLLSHIGMVCILAILFHKINIEAINKLLLMYWSIKYFVLGLILILLIKELVMFKKSFKKVINHFSKIYYYVGLTYIFSAISTKKINLTESIIFILSFIFVWSILQLISLDMVNNEDNVDENSDVEIKLYKQLMPTRKKELEKVLKILINNNYNEPFALLLNGNWGEGKTSLINVLTKKLKMDGNYNIFIQPLMLDTSEKLMEYFFGQLEIILKLNGIYTGKGSPFKKYINIVFQSINTLNLKQVIKLDTFLNEFDDDQQLDFRKTKETLENDINRLLESNKNKKQKNIDEDLLELINYQVDLKKIFIIVDDFDRVEEETFKNTLIFIKELVNFKGINVIFLMDDSLLEKNKMINRDYLDKFVNTKIQLSKIGYQELFEYFVKNIKNEKAEDKSYNYIVKKIKMMITEKISNLIKEFEEDILTMQKKIDSLNESKAKEDVTVLKNELIEKKTIAESNINKLKNGLSNSRKVKKIIREIQETLNIITENKSLETQNLKRINDLEAVIIRISIYKILFGIDLDVIHKNYNDFYTVMMNEEAVMHKENNVIKIFFGEYFRNNYSEDRGIKIDILNDFFNALIFNDSLEKLNEDKKTETQSYLDQLDSVHKELDINNFEEVKKIQKAMMFNSFYVDNNVNYLRKKKLIDKITKLYNSNMITFKELFEVLNKSQRNLFLDDELYLSSLKKIIENMSNFQNSDDEKISIYLMDRLSEDVFLKYKSDIIELINLQNSIKNLSDDLKNIFQFESMITELKKVFPEKNTSDSSLEFFEELIEEIMNEVESENKDNMYIILASKDYEENVRRFINIYTLSEDIKKELRNMRITYGSRFENRIMYTNKDELFGDLSYMYEFISKDNLIIYSDAVDYLENFRFLLLELEHYLMTEDDIEKEKFGVVEEIYSSLPIDIYRKNSESKELLTFCTKKLGEILKKLNYTSG